MSGWARYRRVFSRSGLRTVILLGMLVRIPTFATNLVLTLHVVSRLGKSYAAAGVIAAVSTIAMAISNPWRGRLLDRFPLRRVLVPSIVVGGACWSIAPFVGYVPLALLVALSSLFTVPSIPLVRQAVIALVEDEDRRAALSLDSVGVETAYMLGPILGVWAATTWRTDWVLFGSQAAVLCGGTLLWVVNPPIHKPRQPADGHAPAVSRAQMFTPSFAMLGLVVVSASVVLISTELSTVAAMQSFGAREFTGIALASWGAGSLVGGLVYGAAQRSLSPTSLLIILGAITLPLAAARNVPLVVGLVFVAGLLCAPMIVATLDEVSRITPEAFRGEAMGWHASAMTVGSALGAPLAGVLIDRWGWRTAIATMALFGLAAALLAARSLRARSQTTPAAS